MVLLREKSNKNDTCNSQASSRNQPTSIHISGRTRIQPKTETVLMVKFVSVNSKLFLCELLMLQVVSDYLSVLHPKLKTREEIDNDKINLIAIQLTLISKISFNPFPLTFEGF